MTACTAACLGVDETARRLHCARIPPCYCPSYTLLHSAMRFAFIEFSEIESVKRVGCLRASWTRLTHRGGGHVLIAQHYAAPST